MLIWIWYDKRRNIWTVMRWFIFVYIKNASSLILSDKRKISYSLISFSGDIQNQPG